MTVAEQLAIKGGPKTIPKGTIKKWPPIDDTDRKFVLASLEGGQHACGPNCGAFEKEFGAWNGNKLAITTNSGTAALQLWSFGETRKPSEERDYHAYALGWMYRNNDLTAAFGRAQLARLDRYLAQQRENAQALTAALRGVPGLILPSEPPGCVHNWYNYTVRFDMEALGHAADASEFRFKIMKALQAEGVETSVWQAWILPAMTVFQAKNGFGKGHPWSAPNARPVDYALHQYPHARRHADTHTGMTTPLRAPNGPDVAALVAKAFRKVMENVEQL